MVAPTFGSLFAGVGGLDMGFEAAGFRCAWQVEIDSAARGVLAHHWPGAPRFEDVRAVGASNLTPVNVVVGGFPCQDLSVAGNRKGLAGSRSGLFYEMTRVIDELKPHYVVWENVPGLLTSDGGRDFARVLVELGRVGYRGGWRILDLQFFGTAQRRRRVFGVFSRGHLGAECASEVLALKQGVFGDSPKGQEAGEGVAFSLTASVGRNRTGSRIGNAWKTNYAVGALTATDGGPSPERAAAGQYVVAALAACGVGTCGADDNQAQAGHLLDFGGNQSSGERCVAASLYAKGGTGRIDFETETFIVNAAESCAVKDHARRSGIARCLDRTGGFAANQGGTVVVGQCQGSNVGPLGTLRAGNGAITGGVPFVTACRNSPNNGSWETGDRIDALTTGTDRTAHVVTHTLTGNGFDASEDGTGRGTPLVPAAASVRRLTPLECERLMGWPDNWTRYSVNAKGETVEQADGARYRQCGNGVGRPHSEWIARRLMATMECDGGSPLAVSEGGLP